MASGISQLLRPSRAVCIGGVLAACALAGSVRAGKPPDLPSLPWPGGDRGELCLPDTVWERILAPLPRGDRPLGYTAEQMANFGRDQFRLRTVENLFRDARGIPRMSGKLAEDLLANASRPAEILSRAFALTDVSAGRNLPLADSSSWGVPWLSDATSAAAALDSVLARCRPADARDGNRLRRLASGERGEWEKLPEPAQRLVIRVLIGAVEAGPFFRLALEDVERCFPESGVDSLYKSVIAPWAEERLGQLVTLRKASLDALRKVDREYLEFGSILFLTHLDRALREYLRAAQAAGIPAAANRTPAAFRGSAFPSALGLVRITGKGDDTLRTPAFLSLDLGGNDVYLGRHGVNDPKRSPIGLVLDLKGDDTYDGGPEPVTLGCGLFGLGAVFDLEGDDSYHSSEAGLGAAWYGVGLLYDEAGDDRYLIDSHAGQGSGCAGVGMLIDRKGDDSYTCGYGAQGYGETFGAGILLDVEGDDVYLARDDGNRSALYNNQSVSMAQGVGQGRRADLGDGHSLAGGFGVLVDGAGDDSYHASAWSQGAGYWWAVGILEDLGGDDRYRNGKYASGAAAHFAIGCEVDLSGDDQYNIGNAEAVNQYQGHARDGSIGVSIDGDGDDRYQFRSHCGGSADLNSIGFFWDRRGDDLYQARYDTTAQHNGWTDTPPMGTATVYPPPFRSFRDDLDAVGLFLDTGGADQVEWLPATADSSASNPKSGPPEEDAGREHPNDSLRLSHRGQASWGLGLDTRIYPAADPRKAR